VKPGDDFHRYASGTWLRTTQIPADRTGWSLWTVLSEDIERQLRAIVTEGATSRDPGQRKVADFYAAWMDEAGVEARGTAPLRPYLQRITAIRNRGDLLAVFATPGYQSPVGVGIIPDLANPTRYTAIAGQGGLGMPNRDYYLREGAQFDRYRAAYRDYVIQLQRLAGIADPEARADRIIALERRIAEAHWTPERSRDIQAINNPMNRAQLAQLAPQFEWDSYLQRRGLSSVTTVIATQTTAITGIGRLLDEVPLDTWKDYLAFHFINSYAQYLPRAFDEAQSGVPGPR
jgi:endothelin-converting enzyme/putative endopeptidase